MKNTLTDLNNHLFACIERLNDENLTDEELEKETKRCESISKIASTIVANANVQLQAYKNANEYGNSFAEVPSNILVLRDDRR